MAAVIGMIHDTEAAIAKVRIFSFRNSPPHTSLARIRTASNTAAGIAKSLDQSKATPVSKPAKMDLFLGEPTRAIPK